MASKSGDKEIWQLHISLRDSNPPIWRRVLVPGSVTLKQLDRVIQRSLDWENSHLHEFRIKTLVRPGRDGFEPPSNAYEARVRLAESGLKRGSKFQYVYDFGDDWLHDIKVEKMLERDPEMKYPVCIEAAGAAPPEDCGGLWGYYDMAEAISDPEHPDHEDYLEWWGDDTLDVDWVDLDAINKRLSLMKL